MLLSTVGLIAAYVFMQRVRCLSAYVLMQRVTVYRCSVHECLSINAVCTSACVLMQRV